MISTEVFSFHLNEFSIGAMARPFFKSPSAPGLLHFESFYSMELGFPIFATERYGLRRQASFAWWKDEASLDSFTKSSPLERGWHVRLKLYRRWGRISEIAHATVDPDFAPMGGPVVAVTLARLKLSEARRFTQWGKPVERQVRDDRGQRLALAAIRPLNTFCTFSIWNSEADMIRMVQTENLSHKLAMHERDRKDFHHEFTTLRFAPIGEFGSWNGRSDYTA